MQAMEQSVAQTQSNLGSGARQLLQGQSVVVRKRLNAIVGGVIARVT